MVDNVGLTDLEKGRKGSCTSITIQNSFKEAYSVKTLLEHD